MTSSYNATIVGSNLINPRIAAQEALDKARAAYYREQLKKTMFQFTLVKGGKPN